MSKTKLKPFLKWAGGKSQLLEEIQKHYPCGLGTVIKKYAEPFIGGGAVFFDILNNYELEALYISDTNAELINVYCQIKDNVGKLLQMLNTFQGEYLPLDTESRKEYYYAKRERFNTLKRDHSLSAETAALFIFLNKTCFNGLYRVNKQGKFNVPYGKYANPRICDEEGLKSASKALKKADILCGDYLLVLEHYAEAGDFVFLDPPYLPISEYADFKRYTKEQFYEEDHIELAKIIMRLQERGCHIILTNSNHPLVHELYAPFTIDVIQTKRQISCNGSTRKGEDVIVTIPPKQQTLVKLELQPMPQQVSAYPPTRFMGSKSKLLSEIWSVVSQFNVNTVVDLFSGSGVVGYMLKAQGKAVVSNDYMAMSATFTKAMIENNTVTLPLEEAKELLSDNLDKDFKELAEEELKGVI